MIEISFDDIKKTIWLTRPDLRSLDSEFPGYFEFWLSGLGKIEYNSLEPFKISPSAKLMSSTWPGSLNAGALAITEVMILIWRLRPDLREAFDLDNKDGQSKYWLWYILHGRREYHITEYLTKEQSNFLNSLIESVRGEVFGAIPRLMYAIWYDRPDLQLAFDLDDPITCDKYICWFFCHGAIEYGLLPSINISLREYLLSPPVDVIFSSIPRAFATIWRHDSALQERYPNPNQIDLTEWAKDDVGAKKYPLLDALLKLSTDCCEMEKLAAPIVIQRQRGVNLIGYARAQLGIGEDVRMAALALKTTSIPFSIFNINPGQEVCQNDYSVESYISTERIYDTNLFCMTGIETARLHAVYGNRLFDSRKNIGYWPWELPIWPEAWHHCYKLVDEVWASSRYTFEAFMRSSPKTLRHMPMAVSVNETAGLTRGDFCLPEGLFLFVFSFDFLSSLSRKNPQACVAAFRVAFPRGDEPVGLVVKAMRAADDNPLWHKLQDEARSDKRITIINRTLDRGEVFDLYRVCDCFISLHRSEGFGRGMAEAMMLGKPVVCTGYSGNLDFTLTGTAGLVDYQLRDLGVEDYPFGSGTSWAEPDIDHAAWWMRRIANEPTLRTRLAKTGQMLATNTYEASVVGATYDAVLGV